jgi:outer membrane protein OmpA-like peptidoglycan-associated protein
MKWTRSFALALGLVCLAATGVSAQQDVQSSGNIVHSLTRGGLEAPDQQQGATVNLQIQFAYNSAQLTPQAATQLDALAKALNDPSLTTSSFRVEGHTDSSGAAGYNQKLSERRAESVKHYLVQHGVSARRLAAVGMGSSQPLPDVDGSTEEGKEKNRRVAVVNLGSAGNPPAAQQAASSGHKPPSAGHGAAAVTSGAAAKPQVQVIVQYERNGQKDEVKEGTVLHPIDNYNVSFTPATRSYVYVFRFDAGGNASMVFPNKEYSASVNPVVGQHPYVVPSDGQWLKLQGTPGDEEIIVLASANNIDNATAVAKKLRGMKRGMELDAVETTGIAVPADLFSYRLPYKTLP